MSIKAPTHHIAAEYGDFAKTVLMPGDPLRAKFIAETYLEEMQQINETRCMYAYTGLYRGKRVSVMASGIGVPSTATHAWELYNLYGVENIIRVGTAGGMAEGLEIGDVVLATGASYQSNFVAQYDLPGTFSAVASFPLLMAAANQATAMEIPYTAGTVISSDIFYPEANYSTLKWSELMGVLCVEMESAALYTLAARHKKQALSILTISDHLVTGIKASAEERERTYTAMMELALEVAPT